MTSRKVIDEALLRQLWAAGATCQEIGNALGCSHALASKRAGELGLPRRATDPTQLPARKIIAAYRDHGMTLEQIRVELRKSFPLASVTGIRNLLKAHGVAMRSRSYRTSPTGTSHIAECVRLARQGVPYREIGRQFGLTQRQVALRVRRVLPAIQTGCWHRYDRDSILAAYERTKSYAKAAREVGCHWSAVRYHVDRRKAVAS
jgi:hypothetical protein